MKKLIVWLEEKMKNPLVNILVSLLIYILGGIFMLIGVILAVKSLYLVCGLMFIIGFILVSIPWFLPKDRFFTHFSK